MQIAVLILLIAIAALIVKKEFGPRVLAANSNEWLVLEWYKLSDVSETGIRSRENQTPSHVEFVPIIGWTYDHYGYKYGKPTPITPPAYRVQDRLDSETKYKTVSYWVRDGAVFDISDYWSHAGDFWENLSDQAAIGTKIEIHGCVPSSFQKKLSEILAIANERRQGTLDDEAAI
jgi:hypothetical protein